MNVAKDSNQIMKAQKISNALISTNAYRTQFDKNFDKRFSGSGGYFCYMSVFRESSRSSAVQNTGSLKL